MMMVIVVRRVYDCFIVGGRLSFSFPSFQKNLYGGFYEETIPAKQNERGFFWHSDVFFEVWRFSAVPCLLDTNHKRIREERKEKEAHLQSRLTQVTGNGRARSRVSRKGRS